MTFPTGTLTGDFASLTGAPSQGSIGVALDVPMIRHAASGVCVSGSLSAPLDAGGSFAVAVPADDAGWHVPFRFRVTLPGGRTVNVPVPSPGAVIDVADYVT